MIYSNHYKALSSDTLIIFSHGIGEHQGIYESFKNQLVDANYSVLLYDIRGHGQSHTLAGQKSYQIFMDDLSSLVDTYRQQYKKIYLIGHSFGAIISNMYAQLIGNIDGVISIGYQYKIIKKVKYLGFLLPRKQLVFNWSDKNSRHEKTEAEMNDPLLLKSIKFRWLYQTLIKMNAYIHKHVKDVKIPYLILHGGSDRIVDVNNACYFFSALENAKKEIIIYPNSYHDLLLDIDKDIVIKDIIRYLQAQI
ncbi:MAG: hypothetical protein CVV63_02745 [Tenericutes bacterium HGW-Tenericutes-8]|nr:MAG: hypothetical protein CVV63_02745 [Tenericutes bacterium HGW-Tenericutes-8]